MKTIFSIYNKIKVKEVSYETGDNFVTAHCEVLMNDEVIDTKLIITHSDLNRIIAKIVSLGFEFKVDNISRLDFEDGTEIIDYKFENVFGENIVLENFQFNQEIKRIRA
ncbi:MAG: hypothetical protein ACI857_002702 [Arenicella sp.]|jgi:hypothetical protein